MDHTNAKLERSASNEWRRPRLLAAAGVAAAAVGVGGVLAILDKGPAPHPPERSTLVLSIAPGGAMKSCVPFDVAVLRDMPVAFAGTATAVNADSVTLEVDRWYTGAPTDRVTVNVPAGQTSVALDGVKFIDGQQYLLTATNGTINGCGFSGPATPELEEAFAAAFGA
jgi:hypothetical protein